MALDSRRLSEVGVSGLPLGEPRDHPNRQPEFRPQPGDIVIRKIRQPHTPDILSVMGILRIYSDKYYFMCAEGDPHRVKFAFRKGDLILRFGRFTSKYYTWVYEELASLYLFYCTGPQISETSPGSWYKVAQRQNPEPNEYIENPDPQVPLFTPELHRECLRPGMFRLDRGDYLIHQIPVQAPDRPWGVSYELRVVEAHYVVGGSTVIWSRDDVCVRVRMRTPPSDEGFQVARGFDLDFVMEYVDNVLDEFVPMYVYGFLCLGTHSTGHCDWDAAANRYIVTTHPEGIWRYLSFDHHVFTNFQKRLQDDPNRRYFQDCPVRPGDLVLNLDERVNTMAGRRQFSIPGHIMIARDGPQELNRAENVPGSMIIRLGYFLDPGARENIYIHREYEMNFFQPERDDFLIWAETVSPEVYTRSPLTESSWINATIDFSSELDAMPADPMAPLHPEIPRGVGLEHPPLQLYRINQRVEHNLEFTHRDLIFNKDPSADHLAMFSRDAIGIWSWNSETRVDFLLPGDRSIHRYQLLRLEGENAVNVIYWNEDYSFRDGDHLIRHNIEENQENFLGKRIVTVELYAYHKIPTRWNLHAEGFWVFRGRDRAVLPVRDFPAGQPRVLFDDLEQ